MSAICSRDDLEARGEVLLARADVDADEPGVGVLRARSCRRRRPSRASRGSPGRAATTPSRRGSRRGARRRSGGGRSARSRARRCRRGTARCPCAGSGGRAAARCTSGGRTRGALPGGSARCARWRARAGATSCVVLEVPGGGDDDVAGDVHRPVVRARSSAGVTLEITSARPITGRPSGCVAEDRLREQVVDELLRRVLVHRDLLEHDLALGVEVGEASARRPCRAITSSASRGAGRGRARRRPCARARSPRSARRRARRRSRRSAARRSDARALEEQVLDEVRDARLRVGLVARAGADPEAERDRADARERAR